MNDLVFFCLLSLGSLIAIYLFWFVCQFNGKTILYYLGSFNRHIPTENFLLTNTKNNHQDSVTIYLIGIMPVAVLSILTARFDRCFNSLFATLVFEFVVFILFLFIPSVIKKQAYFFGIQTIKNNLNVVFYASLWCLSFALWATISHQQPLDYMISNTNPDMWAYVRRFGAMTTDNLFFYRGFDSFTFENNSACAYLLGSPKKFSSFLGSIIVYIFGGSSIGIGVFQGTLGGILFLCLFKEWFTIKLTTKNGFSGGKFLLITWALSSPSIYWLMISAYFSNALFVIMVCLALRQGRNVAINCQVDSVTNLFCFASLLIIVFAFYPAFLPVIIFVYSIVILVYLPSNCWQLSKLSQIIGKFFAVIFICGLVFYFIFPTQLGLEEVQKSLNVLTAHGSNFVPLNPWSLLQEKPKPMALQRDFGWYFNIVISLPISIFIGWKLWQKYQRCDGYLARRDLLAGIVGVGIYLGYLLAYIPLEHSYRLMKIVISLVYPIAIFGVLPFIMWSKNKLEGKSNLVKQIFLVLAIAHVIFHIHKVFDLNPYPTGNFTITNPEKLKYVQNITLVACPEVHVSQFYERLVGLKIARLYPNLQVNVIKFPEDIEQITNPETIVYGETRIENKTEQKTCHFSF